LAFYVLAVTSEFPPELVNTAKWRKKKPNESTDQLGGWRVHVVGDATTEILEDTDTVIPLNTGIIVGYNIKFAA